MKLSIIALSALIILVSGTLYFGNDLLAWVDERTEEMDEVSDVRKLTNNLADVIEREAVLKEKYETAKAQYEIAVDATNEAVEQFNMYNEGI